ncbi:MAG: glycosyltransferase [Ardenticatenaceae bacterium]|nr:glycosyltransferase [Ardenticatenaceae bacterium]
MKFSVIIPARNAANTIGDTLWALRRQTIPAGEIEIIVVDDGSTDATAAVAKALGARVLTQSHAGPAAARNAGARAASGALLLFTDADCVPAPDWVTKLTAPLADPDIAGAKGVYTTDQRAAVARLVQIEYEEKYARLAARRDIDFIDTYSAVYRRDIFLAAGGFDESFRAASVEDQEFSFRLVQAGYRLHFAPGARVAHRHVETLPAYARRKYRYGYWKALLLRRHPGRIAGDSHTPRTQLVHMAWLLGLIPATVGALALRRHARTLLVIYGLAGAGSAAPFLVRVTRRAPELLPLAPVFLATRALALDLGLSAGGLAAARRRIII